MTTLCDKLPAISLQLTTAYITPKVVLSQQLPILWDDIPRLKSPILDGTSAIYYPDAVHAAIYGSCLSHFNSDKL
ncbi:hypothetical protein NUV71_17755 [Shewanella xiamenensis]|nr:hypothetical protein [Shewanella xiamenensis]